MRAMARAPAYANGTSQLDVELELRPLVRRRLYEGDLSMSVGVSVSPTGDRILVCVPFYRREAEYALDGDLTPPPALAARY
jgi:hypothetical protein